LSAFRALTFFPCLLYLTIIPAWQYRDKPGITGGLVGSPPVIAASADIDLAGEPIWATGQKGQAAVALFRHQFAFPGGWSNVELSIMADTRYEVWLDGNWLGRGPARFSRIRQEFDAYAISGLSTGQHMLAVLVQYAPNTRRSESDQPALQAAVRAWDGSGWQVVAATDASWKATVSPAWDTDARLISESGLIGPMELLDLRSLPVDWMQPGFDDSTWPLAHLVIPSPFPALSARTIPHLRDQNRAPQFVVETGLLSPGYRLLEFEDPTGGGLTMTSTVFVTASISTVLRVEALDAGPVVVDGGQPPDWIPLDDLRRPDVMAAEQSIGPGRHTLSVVLAGGRTLAIRLHLLTLADNLGVVPVHDPGRRTLLANPVAGGGPTVQLFSDYAEVTVPAGATPCYVVLDFGRTLHARLSLVAEGPVGTIVDAGWDERLTAGRPLPNPGSLGSNAWSQVDSWVLDGTARQLTTLDTRSGRYLLLQVYGLGPVYLHQVQAVEETYPVDQVGSFASSDPLLDRIWQMGVDTLTPNMTDAYTDTPWRERGQWWSDALIAFHTNRAAFGDLALFRRGLRQVADAIDLEGHPAPLAPNGAGMVMLDYGMQWVEGLSLYWRLGDDLALVEELYPAAQRLVGFLVTYEGSSGLLDIPPGHWSQTALVDWPAVSSRSGESAALNAQYAYALRQMGDMAEAMGDHGQAQAYESHSAAVQAAINDVLFLPEQGCYATSRLNGELVPPGPHAQAWALRYGIVPAERRSSVVRALIRHLHPFFNEQGWSVVEPLGMFYVLEALSGTNATMAGLNLVRERYGDLISQGAATWWELYTPNQRRDNSLSHAWGSSPTWFLSSHVLGGLATGPTTWRVAPHIANLAAAQGNVPLAGGTLEIAWLYPSCGQFYLTMAAPQNTAGEILLPVSHQGAQVMFDGLLVWDGGPTGQYPAEMTADGLLLTSVDGGTHQVTAAFSCHLAFLPLVAR